MSEPRIEAMIALLRANAREIEAQPSGRVEIDFGGGHVDIALRRKLGRRPVLGDGGASAAK